MSIPADATLETSTVTGTGNVTVTGPVTGWRSLASAVTVGDTFPYTIEGVDANGNRTGEFECGDATLLTATTFSRDIVDTSSNANNLVSFSAGTKYVSITINAKNLPSQAQIYACSLGLSPI